jgi:allantoin racemase
MRLLMLNPNTSASFTDRIQEIARQSAASGTEIMAVNPTMGPRSIESVYDELLSSQGTLEVALANLDACDAICIACYSDHPTIYALREITTRPVLGIAEASMMMACLVGRKFSVVTTNDEWAPLLADAAKRYGLAERCASIRATGMPVLALESGDEEANFNAIVRQAQLALDEDEAEAICLGCAGMAGLDKRLEQVILAPVLDGVACAVKLLEGLVSCGMSTSKRRTYAQPRQKELVNLPAVFQKPYKNLS